MGWPVVQTAVKARGPPQMQGEEELGRRGPGPRSRGQDASRPHLRDAWAPGAVWGRAPPGAAGPEPRHLCVQSGRAAGHAGTRQDATPARRRVCRAPAPAQLLTCLEAAAPF